MMRKFLLYINTIKYLKPVQIYGRVFSKLKSKIPKNYTAPNKLETNLKLKTDYIKHDPWNNRDTLIKGNFCFLNQKLNLSFPPKWNPEADLLWLFNLHYFHYLYLLKDNEKEKILLDWINKNPIGVSPSWHPYVISLRLINWIREDLKNSEILKSIYIQTKYLYHNLEYYHPANHYLENAKALIFAGLFFNKQKESQKWLKKGIDIYKVELKKQVFDDGTYFEKSVMYHAIILVGILDILNILPSSNENYNLFSQYASQMLDFLIHATHPSGSIALFNDSTEEIAPPSNKLMDYAKNLNLNFNERKVAKYFKNAEILTFSDKELYFIIKGGKIGPDNIPAHAHADIFTFELSYLGEKVIVDAGVFDYQNNVMRKYCRSTAAHNCISIDDKDQAEVWSVFRVGRRYYPKLVELNTEENIVYKGSFGGYGDLIGDNLFHLRTFNYNKITRLMKVSDEIFGNGKHVITSNLHLHPSIELIKIGEKKYRANNKYIEFDIITNGNKVIIEKGFYCSKFGKKNDNIHMKLISNELPCNLSYEFNFNKMI